MYKNASENQGRLIARIVWQLLKAARYATIADLTADVKSEAARLRIRVTPDDLNDAYRLIESNAALTADAPRLPAREPTAADRPGELSAADARDVLADIRRRLGVPATPKPIPTATPIRPRRRDRVRALRLVADAMRDSIDACERLERDADERREP